MKRLSTSQSSVKYDHNYAAAKDYLKVPTFETRDGDRRQQKLIHDLYHHVCIDTTAVRELELAMWGQHQSDRWHHECKLHMTASGIREICH